LDENELSIDGLVHDHVLGPDLSFSPLVFVKVRTIYMMNEHAISNTYFFFVLIHDGISHVERN
jgi:hypothetical protein